jgi:hypothetical protein
LEAIRFIHGSELGQQISRVSLYIKDGSIDADALWELYVRVDIQISCILLLCMNLILQLANVLVQTKQFGEFKNVAVTALICPQFMNDPQKARVK